MDERSLRRRLLIMRRRAVRLATATATDFVMNVHPSSSISISALPSLSIGSASNSNETARHMHTGSQLSHACRPATAPAAVGAVSDGVWRTDRW